MIAPVRRRRRSQLSSSPVDGPGRYWSCACHRRCGPATKTRNGIESCRNGSIGPSTKSAMSSALTAKTTSRTVCGRKATRQTGHFIVRSTALSDAEGQHQGRRQQHRDRGVDDPTRVQRPAAELYCLLQRQARTPPRSRLEIGQQRGPDHHQQRRDLLSRMPTSRSTGGPMTALQRDRAGDRPCQSRPVGGGHGVGRAVPPSSTPRRARSARSTAPPPLLLRQAL